MTAITFGSLFAGIGGADLGLERAGMQCKWQVEIDDYATRVLEKHWPNVKRWRDVRTFPQPGFERVDLIVGGFPCQDISTAGTGKGLDGARSGMWFEYLRIIRALRPRFVVIENSPALIVRGLDRLLCDLAESGFDAEWQTVFASDFTLPHRRERIIVVANANGQHGAEGVGSKQNRPIEIFPPSLRQRNAVRIQATDHLIGVNDGVRGRAYRNRGRVVGNAIVPPVAQYIGTRIIDSLKAQP